MLKGIEGLIDQFERGALSRRQLIGALALLVTSKAAAADTQTAIAPCLGVNHAHFDVVDLDKSITFYGELLGTKVYDRTPGNATLELPGKPGWISLTQLKQKDAKGHVNHVGFGVKLDPAKGDAGRLAKEINAKYPEAKAKPTGDTKAGTNTRTVYLYDPSGIYIQLVPKDDFGWLPTGTIGAKIRSGEIPAKPYIRP